MGTKHAKAKRKHQPASSPIGKERIGKAIQEMKDRGELPDTTLVDGKRQPIKMIRVDPICWGIPFDEIVFAKWAKNILGHLRPMPWDDTIFAGSTYVPEARNKIHGQFLNDSKCEVLMMLDSDVLPPPGFEQKLLGHMRDNSEVRMIGGWYRLKGDPYNPVVYHYEGMGEDGKIGVHPYGNNEIGTGLEEVDMAGAGCWMMHRSVAEAIGEKPYDMSEGGEDLLLCKKVREAGFKLWIDWSITCAHAGVAVA